MIYDFPTFQLCQVSYLSPLVQWDMDDYGCENGDLSPTNMGYNGDICVCVCFFFFCIVYIYSTQPTRSHFWGMNIGSYVIFTRSLRVISETENIRHKAVLF